MRYSKSTMMFVFFWGILCFQPQTSGNSQGTKETIKVEKAKIRSDSAQKKVDSIFSANDSLRGKVVSQAGNLIAPANRLNNKIDQLEAKVNKLANQKTDTMAIVKTNTKYVPVPGMVDKKAYWEHQRYLTDSIHKAKQDSIKKAMADRSLFRKILGLKPRKKK